LKGFTSEKKESYFDVYKSELKKVNHQAHKICNVDETGITTVQHTHTKVVSARDKKEEASLTLAKRGNLINVVTSMNVAGI
jgi:hypothetical protein